MCASPVRPLPGPCRRRCSGELPSAVGVPTDAITRRRSVRHGDEDESRGLNSKETMPPQPSVMFELIELVIPTVYVLLNRLSAITD